ncbi:hypothetical protein COW36_13245 [bacterium (Candidatus Blackallbacteria) CG17_big_fil_post_rev_8_21_14_2_50_48_46]|uniref:protein O-GlcNAc transferase n=1 Tax=bacterium (Candidatus Blackallbacteria) CG17_big_fil_post_rev_8_21_14_2_50_48_46 TaxID=2014261 RepID=A0A2M7G3E0_9BACT|nr:MAG: hypothetical protein COW64_21860 [bacterium (Candidatus Blackallbacteria) CG18_big_fil_WC_8_21_14_2_50_49_26]PIW16297.1 MAG: hypothetical protein COW36_13245 [bacterium (Candidatus Blackallbacteria) CG17_big_fil_post_rev_8_21_14_2_50_48_46]PIW45311.1 MAG: hypothetical protein COW20_20480 [bacterium (Candidatus Blackallbacteria) CG13_big_fil_rev_8_21_14_2_50_49_14]
MFSASFPTSDIPVTNQQLAILRETLQRAPEREENWINLGNLLFQMGEYQEAIQLLQEGARKHENSAPLKYNLGYMLEGLQQWPISILCYQAALELNPQFFEAWFRLGEVFRQTNRHTEAVQVFQRAFKLKPDYLPCLQRIVEQLTLCGDSLAVIQAAELFLKEDLETSAWYLGLNAETQKYLSTWIPRLEGLQIFSFFCREEIDTPALMGAIRDFSRRHAEKHYPENLPDRDLNPERKLRIGYLSNEFHSESFYQLHALLFQNQNREKFEYFAYADCPTASVTAETLREYFHSWQEVASLDDEALFKLLSEDQLDLLVDMSGLANPGRLPVLARKPVPLLLISGSNPPFTSGLKVADWLFSDPVLTPPDIAELYPEKIWPSDCFLHWTLPEIPYESGLPPVFERGYITFGSANSINKLSGRCLELWAQILKQVPQSRLCLKTFALDDPVLCQELQAWFLRQGLNPERLMLLGTLPEQPHLPMFYGQIDIALDPFPYNGGLTSFEALWMGVPVISLAGERRVGQSVLTALGFSEWVAQNPQAYLQKAVNLAQDPAQLKALRLSLRPQIEQSVLCDGVAFARERETAYREIWRKYCLASEQNQI